MPGQIQDVDLKLMRVFRAVVRNGGFAAAQTDLNVSLPTISLQMKQLEERLGLRLCERGQGGFRLTAQGLAVIQSAEKMFAAIGEFRNDIAELTKAPIGEVRLGMLEHLSANPECRVHEAVASLHDRYAGVELVFFVGPPDELEAQILGGTLDLAVGLFPSARGELVNIDLFDEEHDLYCAQGHPLFDTKADDAAVSAADYVSWAYLEPFVAPYSPLPLKGKGGSPFMAGVVTILLSGRYIGYLPRYFAERWVSAGQLKAIAPARFGRRVPVRAISRQDHSTERGVSALRDAIMAAHNMEALASLQLR